MNDNIMYLIFWLYYEKFKLIIFVNYKKLCPSKKIIPFQNLYTFLFSNTYVILILILFIFYFNLIFCISKHI